MLSTYVVVSLVLFSASLFTRLPSTTSWKIDSPALSGINLLSPAARLDKLVSLHPPPIHFAPYTHLPVVGSHSHEVTACLWTTESNLDWVPSWTNDWRGPTSLVVVTHLPPATTRAPHPALTHLLHHPKLNASRLALHLLHLDPTTPEAPNVFLNLARLFAPTRTLLLVPGTPKPPPPSSISSLSMAHIRDPAIVRMAAPGHGTGIATTKGRLSTPVVLSPMLILRDHPLWCTERFAFAPAPSAPRTVDWDACLWQAQLETFGAASTGGPTLPGWRWDVEPGPAEPALPSISLTSAIRRRVDVRYRVETCVLAIKRLEVLGEDWRSGGRGRVGARFGRKGAEKMRWLHEICRQWSHGA
ncbi:hypothetical protein V8E52_010203 [Russula decolorans]